VDKTYVLPRIEYRGANVIFEKQTMAFTLYSDATGTRCKAIYTGKLRHTNKRKKHRSARSHAKLPFRVLNAAGVELQVLKTKTVKIPCKNISLRATWDVPPEEFDLITNVDPDFPRIYFSRCT
jgi:hypothetical protein